MPKIDNEQIIEIRNKVNIVDIIAEYVPLVQRGKNYFGVCPFHDDHNPSMSVSPEKQIYTCFVCGASGNVFTFLMEYEHISFIEAVKMVANKVGINIDVGNTNKSKAVNKQQNIYNIYELATKFYQNNLFTKGGKEAKDYLGKRLFTDDIIKEFQIGLSLGKDQTYQLLKSHNFSEENILKSGLCAINDKYPHDTFVNRIMFPLWDLDGQVVAFSGRIYNKEDASKYINSKESDIFKKGNLLYNYHRAKEEIRKSKQVIIVEGFMDVIALYKVNIKNVIATMGTAVTSEQAQLIKKLSPNIILCFDGDDAGNKATISCSNELMKIGVTPKIIRLEEKLDPDEYLQQKGVEKFQYLVDNPISLIDYKFVVNKSGKNFNNSDEKMVYINMMIKEISLVNDELLKELSLNKLSTETNVSIEMLNNILKKEVVVKKKAEPKPIVKESKLTLNKYGKAEQRLLFYMLKHKEVINIYNHNNCFISTQIYRYLANEIVYFYELHHDINIADFIAFLEDKKELVDAVGKIITLQLPENYSYEEINDYINLLNKQAIALEINRLKELFKNETNPLSQAEIGKQIAELIIRSDNNEE